MIKTSILILNIIGTVISIMRLQLIYFKNILLMFFIQNDLEIDINVNITSIIIAYYI